jgi:hypothetical protein
VRPFGWTCPDLQPVQKSRLNCGKLHLTNGAVPLSPGPPTRGAPPGTDMNGIVGGVSAFCGRRCGSDGDQFG